jgi:hypothetical protein
MLKIKQIKIKISVPKKHRDESTLRVLLCDYLPYMGIQIFDTLYVEWKSLLKEFSLNEEKKIQKFITQTWPYYSNRAKIKNFKNGCVEYTFRSSMADIVYYKFGDFVYFNESYIKVKFVFDCKLTKKEFQDVVMSYLSKEDMEKILRRHFLKDDENLEDH